MLNFLFLNERTKERKKERTKERMKEREKDRGVSQMCCVHFSPAALTTGLDADALGEKKNDALILCCQSAADHHLR